MECMGIFLLIRQECGFMEPSAFLGFLGQLPGIGRPMVGPWVFFAPQYEQIYSVTYFVNATIPPLF